MNAIRIFIGGMVVSELLRWDKLIVVVGVLNGTLGKYGMWQQWEMCDRSSGHGFLGSMVLWGMMIA